MLVSLLLACAPSAPTACPEETDNVRDAPTAEVTAAATALNAFTWDLYGALDKGEDDLFASPWSVATALAMAYGGAEGSTQAQMAAALHVEDAGAFHEGVAAIAADLAAASAPPTGDPCAAWQISLANAVWGEREVVFEEPWKALLADTYDAPLELADFRSDPAGERARLNARVAERTAGHIAELFGPADITADTVVALVDAVHFSGRWRHGFEKGATQDAPFTTLDGGTVTVPMMAVEEIFRYAEADGVQVLALPYRGGDLEMVVILPAEEAELPVIEAGIDATLVDAWVAALETTTVQVGLPRFEARGRADLVEVLGAMGMPSAFDPALADFHGISVEAAEMEVPLHLAHVVHEGWVSVFEDGTEAAAATAVAGDGKDSASEVPFVYADHPFLYFVRDDVTGTILFVGRAAAMDGAG